MYAFSLLIFKKFIHNNLNAHILRRIQLFECIAMKFANYEIDTKLN
jgi:hypothetical protein